jgi:hypothetical protein
MNPHPFEIVSSSTNPTAEQFAQLLSPDVVFHSPVFVQPITGCDFVARLLETVHRIFGTQPTSRSSFAGRRRAAPRPMKPETASATMARA